MTIEKSTTPSINPTYLYNTCINIDKQIQLLAGTKFHEPVNWDKSSSAIANLISEIVQFGQNLIEYSKKHSSVSNAASGLHHSISSLLNVWIEKLASVQGLPDENLFEIKQLCISADKAQDKIKKDLYEKLLNECKDFSKQSDLTNYIIPASIINKLSGLAKQFENGWTSKDFDIKNLQSITDSLFKLAIAQAVIGKDVSYKIQDLTNISNILGKIETKNSKSEKNTMPFISDDPKAMSANPDLAKAMSDVVKLASQLQNELADKSAPAPQKSPDELYQEAYKLYTDHQTNISNFGNTSFKPVPPVSDKIKALKNLALSQNANKSTIADFDNLIYSANENGQIDRVANVVRLINSKLRLLNQERKNLQNGLSNIQLGYGARFVKQAIDAGYSDQYIQDLTNVANAIDECIRNRNPQRYKEIVEQANSLFFTNALKILEAGQYHPAAIQALTPISTMLKDRINFLISQGSDLKTINDFAVLKNKISAAENKLKAEYVAPKTPTPVVDDTITTNLKKLTDQESKIDERLASLTNKLETIAEIVPLDLSLLDQIFLSNDKSLTKPEKTHIINYYMSNMKNYNTVFAATKELDSYLRKDLLSEDDFDKLIAAGLNPEVINTWNKYYTDAPPTQREKVKGANPIDIPTSSYKDFYAKDLNLKKEEIMASGKKLNGWITTEDGTQKHYVNGLLHDDGLNPAEVRPNGTEIHYEYGQIHRGGGYPAMTSAAGGTKYAEKGKYHRVGGQPAVIWGGTKGNKGWRQEWWVNGEMQKGVKVDGTEIYYAPGCTDHESGVLHREDGPAVVYANGVGEYYLHGHLYPFKEEWETALRLLNDAKKTGQQTAASNVETKTTTKKETKKMSTMSDGSDKKTFTDKMKKSAGDAAYRVGAKQTVKLIKTAVITMMKNKGSSDGALAGIAAFLDTPIGEALLSLGIGAGVDYVPGISGDHRVARLSEEMRTDGMASMGNELIGEAMSYVVPELMGILNKLPQVEEATALRVEEKAKSLASAVEDEDEETETQTSAKTSRQANA